MYELILTVFLFSSGNSASVHTLVIPFNSQSACEAAKQDRLADLNQGVGSTWVRSVAKGGCYLKG